ncbi:MAG: ATP-binding protein [Victivallales bacterium]|nr:ATP-binding protein [Victivallales bacterium]
MPAYPYTIHESLKIKALGPLLDVVLDDIRPVTVLVGESGSGKSLILKVLAMMRHVCKMELIRRALKISGVNKTSISIRKDSYLAFAEIGNLVGSETRIGYELSCNGMLNCQISLDKKGFSVHLDDRASNDDAGPFLKIAFISDTRNLLASWARKGANIQSKILDNYFSETYGLWDEAMDAKSSTEQSIDYLNTKLLVGKNKSGRRDVVIVNKAGHKTLFEHGASGEKASIPISIILRYLTRGYDYEQAVRRSYKSIILDAMMGESEGGKRFIPGDKILPFKNYCLFVHIEEPELSLDPMTQLRFADDLMRIMDSAIDASALEASIMFTTHSPYWITALNTIAEEGKNKFLSWKRLGGYLIKNDGTIESLRDEESHLLMTPNMDEASETLDTRYNSALEGALNGND